MGPKGQILHQPSGVAQDVGRMNISVNMEASMGKLNSKQC